MKLETTFEEKFYVSLVLVFKRKNSHSKFTRINSADFANLIHSEFIFSWDY